MIYYQNFGNTWYQLIDRQSVVTTIDEFYASDQPTWSKRNINQLLEYVLPTRVREEMVNSDQLLDVEFDKNSLHGVLHQYTWYPQAMEREYGPRCNWNWGTMFPTINIKNLYHILLKKCTVPIDMNNRPK